MKPKKMILCLIPNNVCNLKCGYCYISQIPDWLKKESELKHDVEYIARALSKERLGGECLINLTGEGETMLQNGIVDLCQLLLLNGHYLEFVTNLTITRVVDQFVALPTELLAHIEFKISFHYAELKKKKLLDVFFENLKKIQEASCSFTLELMPHDEIIPEIDEIIKLCYDHVGAKCQLTIGRADYLSSRGILSRLNIDEYEKIWSQFESSMFDLKMKLLNVKHKEFCYAGLWTLYIDLYTGESRACYGQPPIQNIYEDIDKPILFRPVGRHCVQPYCINGHAHICMGVIPEIASPSYADIRNRTCLDGSEWFSKDTFDFFDTKLYETNKEYSKIQKAVNYFSWYFVLLAASIKSPKKVVRRIKYIFERRKKTHQKQR